MNTWTPMMLPSRGAFDFSAGQLLDLIGWGTITLLAIAVLIRAGKPDVADDADRKSA